MSTINLHNIGLTATLLGSLLFAAALSGCTLLGLGAAAGAAVGGCAILDENQDDQVTEAELSEGVFNAWDANEDDALSRQEFDAGTARSDAFSGVSDDFDTWDTNDDDQLSRQEFTAGVTSDEDALAWIDSGCDDLGL